MGSKFQWNEFVNFRSNFRPWLNYTIAGGHTWVLRNKNLLKANLQMNYTSFQLARGDYEINVPCKPVNTGTYNSRLSAAGISLSYILTSSRKIEVRKFKKELKERGFTE